MPLKLYLFIVKISESINACLLATEAVRSLKVVWVGPSSLKDQPPTATQIRMSGWMSLMALMRYI